MVVKVDPPYLQYLAHNIGISGFKHLLGPDATTVRRLTWLFVILTALAWMVWNIHGRLAYFLSYPTSMETRVIYQDKAAFPQIAICNQNRFRSSQIFRETNKMRKSPNFYEAMAEYYKTMAGHYKEDKHVVTEKYNTFLATTGNKQFLERMAHDKHTLINRCSWKGLPCGPDDFNIVETDLGLCYTFRNQDEKNVVESAGHDSGLSVTLMVEQYDYMRGSRDSAGAVVVISSPDDSEAFADSHGIGVTVGSRTSVGLKKTTMRDMPAPYGDCGEKTLTAFPNNTKYTLHRCELDCLTRYMKEKCGCVQPYMPNIDHAPICSLLDNLKCAVEAKKLFHMNGKTKKCDCPSPCYSEHYTKTISQTQLSQQHVNSLSLQARDDSVSRSTINPSLDHVNQALIIQAWGLLSDFDHSYTDLLDKTTESLLNVRLSIESLTNPVTDFAKEVEQILANSKEPLPDFDVGDESYQPQNQFTNETVLSLTKALKSHSEKMLQAFDSPSQWNMKEFGWGLAATLADDFLKENPQLLSSYIEACSQRHKQLKQSLKLVGDWAYGVLQQWTDNAKNHQDQLHSYNKTVMAAVSKCQDAIDTVTEDGKQLFSLPPVHNLISLRLPLYDHLEPSYFQNNMLSVDIFFEDLSVLDMTKAEAYSVEGLVCDIGGSIGLCLGGSILTFIEVIDLILFSKKKKKEKDNLDSKTVTQEMSEKVLPAEA